MIERTLPRLQVGGVASPADVPHHDSVRLTQYTHGLGCACKLRPRLLENILSELPRFQHPDVIIGMESSDDAAVYRIDDNTAIVHTVDFFTPVVDDAYSFGAIAAANALSDIYAMGAKPLFALNIVGFPSERLPRETLSAILRGAADKAAEAGIPILGGHTIDDIEPKFGMAVVGSVHPDRVRSNCAARPGDSLVLTKAIGTGVLSTALKRGLAAEDVVTRLVEVMSALNRDAAACMERYTVHACTDVTGFGLLGHLLEMTRGSGVNAELRASAVRLLPGVTGFIAAGVTPGGTLNNLAHCEPWITWDDDVADVLRTALADAQTSGGLLIALDSGQAPALLDDLHQAGMSDSAIIGQLLDTGPGRVHVRL
jgi:selenide,water dikinase